MKNSIDFFQIEKFEKDIDGYTNEIRLLHQQTQKFEKQLANTHANNELLQKTLQQNEASYREKVKFFH
jgi:septal ring factor EnvC (AmiA/AmiB activator)